MITILRPPTLLTISLLCISSTVGCGISAGIVPTVDTRGTQVFPWKSNYVDAFQGANQTSSLSDRSHLVISRQGDDEYSIERYSPDMALSWSAPIDFEDGEIFPMVFSSDDRSLILTQIDLDDGVTAIRMRTVDIATGAQSKPETILQSSPRFTRRYFPVISPDRSKIFFLGTSNSFDAEIKGGNEVPAEALGTAIVNVREGTYSSSFDTTYYNRNFDDVRHMAATITNDGTGVIMEIITSEEDDELLYMLVHQIRDGVRTTTRHVVPTRGRDLMAGETSDDAYRPNFLKATVRPNGAVHAAYALTRGGDIGYLATAEIDLAASSVRFSTPYAFTSDNVRMLTDGADNEVSEFSRVEEVIPHSDGSITYLLEKKLIASMMYGTRPRESDRMMKYNEILVLHFDRSGTLASHGVIDREELWDPFWTAYLEGGHLWSVDGNLLHLLTRERERRGLVLHTVNLTTGAVGLKQVLILGKDAYFGRLLTQWTSPDEMTLFIKEGTGGSEWKIVRVRL